MPDHERVTDQEILGGFKSLQDAMEFGFAQIAASFERVDRAISGLEHRTLRRFDEMEKRFDRVDERFERIDERFERIDGRFERLEAHMNERFGRVEERLDRIETR